MESSELEESTSVKHIPRELPPLPPPLLLEEYNQLQGEDLEGLYEEISDEHRTNKLEHNSFGTKCKHLCRNRREGKGGRGGELSAIIDNCSAQHIYSAYSYFHGIRCKRNNLLTLLFMSYCHNASDSETEQTATQMLDSFSSGLGRGTPPTTPIVQRPPLVRCKTAPTHQTPSPCPRRRNTTGKELGMYALSHTQIADKCTRNKHVRVRTHTHTYTHEHTHTCMHTHAHMHIPNIH